MDSVDDHDKKGRGFPRGGTWEMCARCHAGVEVMLRHLQALTVLSDPNPRRGGVSNVSPSSAGITDARLLAAWEAEQVTLRDLGRQVIRTARTRVAALEARVEAAALLVLINDWSVADRVWGELVPDLRAPAIELGFLRELWGERTDRIRVEGESLGNLLRRVGLIQARVEIILFQRHRIMELSNLFEGQLLPWLSQLDRFLRTLHETNW